MDTDELTDAADSARDTVGYVDRQLKTVINALQESDAAGDAAKERFRSLADKLDSAADRLRLAATDKAEKN